MLPQKKKKKQQKPAPLSELEPIKAGTGFNQKGLQERAKASFLTPAAKTVEQKKMDAGGKRGASKAGEVQTRVTGAKPARPKKKIKTSKFSARVANQRAQKKRDRELRSNK